MREKLIELLDDFPVQMEWHDNEELTDFLIANGVTIPVRCKDCKRNCTNHVTSGMIWCGKFHERRPMDGYCHYGERKKDVQTSEMP